MEKRVAILGIFLEDLEASRQVNLLLHEYSDAVIGRMGIPYREHGMSIITVVMDAECDVINALSGKLGKIPSVQVKSMMTKEKGERKE